MNNNSGYSIDDVFDAVCANGQPISAEELQKRLGSCVRNAHIAMLNALNHLRADGVIVRLPHDMARGFGITYAACAGPNDAVRQQIVSCERALLRIHRNHPSTESYKRIIRELTQELER